MRKKDSQQLKHRDLPERNLVLQTLLATLTSFEERKLHFSTGTLSKTMLEECSTFSPEIFSVIF